MADASIVQPLQQVPSHGVQRRLNISCRDLFGTDFKQ
jgi:hypothetical protein